MTDTSASKEKKKAVTAVAFLYISAVFLVAASTFPLLTFLLS
jgi:hypothetical protein